jgi:GntR family transcriptional repressor for pyruvate dehydrogenase complex
VARRKLPEEIVNQMISLIGQGIYKKGTQLPSQTRMAEMFGVNRSTLREAFQTLILLGVLRAYPRQGMVVTGLASEILPRPSFLSALVDQEATDDLFEVRMVLEPAITLAAARRATPGNLWALERLLDQCELALKSGQSVHELAAGFHLLMAQASHNRVFVGLIHSVMGLLASHGERLEGLPGFSQWELASHRRIYEAMTKRIPTNAGGLMVDHLRRSAEAYRQLGQRDQSAPQPSGGFRVSGARYRAPEAGRTGSRRIAPRSSGPS